MMSVVILSSWSALAQGHEVLRGRLVFTDHERAVVRILDLDSGEITHSFDLPKANANLTAVEGGRYVVVQTGDASGTTRILDSGIVRESHGDHDDIEKLAPALLPLTVTGDRPSHVVSEAGQITLFYDGERPWNRKSDPKAVIVELNSLAGEPTVAVRRSAAPQHGIAVPMGGRDMLISIPNQRYAKGNDRAASPRPNGFEILEMRGEPDSWKVLATFNDAADPGASCRFFHGHASSAGTHVFGCGEGEAGGVLAVTRQGGAWSARQITYPDGRRTSAIKGSGHYLVGNYGLKTPYDALLRIDPAAKTLMQVDILAVPGGQPVCQFEVSGRGTRVAHLTPDGALKVYDIAPAWKEVASFEAVPAFDCAYGAAAPSPSLAVIGSRAFVSDPTNGRIREFNLDTLRQALDLPVDGKPTHIAGGAPGG